MSYIIPIGKDTWGSIAWHLIHYFSIHYSYNDCMYILIKTFGYILPCPTCKKHYNYFIHDIYKLEKENSNKNIMIKYLYELHNVINNNLDKNIKISYKKSIKIHNETKNDDIIFFIIIIYSNLNYKIMSFSEFDKIYNFFICFMKNYPDKEIQKKYIKLLNSEQFKESDTPLTFQKWFKLYFKENKSIKKYYERYYDKYYDKYNKNRLKFIN